ncbi:unnamed protein product [Ceutorhynchus assimilis]|uniref:Uncharacterized protein n=1 Tax=Ceutorhynchus assimilis TaxID=467358 RepID=A0A9N9QN97_9CUCU|nr:unnamed protein product [Ceutorhynchus assimilis]
MTTCAQCKLNISDDNHGNNIVKCDICNLDYCGSCFPVSVTEVRVIPLKKRVLFICCPNCRSAVKRSKYHAEKIRHMEEEIQLLKSTIADKITIISDKTKIIDLLHKEQQDMPSNMPSVRAADEHGELEGAQITLSQVGRAVDSAMAHSNVDIQAQAKDGQSSSASITKNADFVGVVRHNGNNKDVQSIKNSQFIGVPKKKWLHVSQAQNSATCESVLAYVKNKASITNRGEISVAQLRTKGDTSSFKVGIDSKYIPQEKNSKQHIGKAKSFHKLNFDLIKDLPGIWKEN